MSYTGETTYVKNHLKFVFGFKNVFSALFKSRVIYAGFREDLAIHNNTCLSFF